MRNVIIPIAAALSLMQASALTQQYIDIIAPQGAGGVEGNSSAIPLNTGGPERFQQVYGSSIFTGFNQGISIAEIGFRVDAFQGRSFSD